MNERDAIERVVKRMQKDRLVKAGSQSDAEQSRIDEAKVKRIAQEIDNRKTRR